MWDFATHEGEDGTRKIGVHYKMAWVLLVKIREAIGKCRAKMKLWGSVQIDGKYIGGHIKPENKKEERIDPSPQGEPERKTNMRPRTQSWRPGSARLRHPLSDQNRHSEEGLSRSHRCTLLIVHPSEANNL
jgi:hypothetical protein